jgi:hypothetical protein
LKEIYVEKLLFAAPDDTFLLHLHFLSIYNQGRKEGKKGRKRERKVLLREREREREDFEET